MPNQLINGPGGGDEAPSKADTSVWMYRGTEARLFASPADVPVDQGWSDRPSEQTASADEDQPKRRGRPPKTVAQAGPDEAETE